MMDKTLLGCCNLNFYFLADKSLKYLGGYCFKKRKNQNRTFDWPKKKNDRVTQGTLGREGKEGAIKRRGGEINKIVGREREEREDGERREGGEGRRRRGEGREKRMTRGERGVWGRMGGGRKREEEGRKGKER